MWRQWPESQQPSCALENKTTPEQAGRAERRKAHTALLQIRIIRETRNYLFKIQLDLCSQKTILKWHNGMKTCLKTVLFFLRENIWEKCMNWNWDFSSIHQAICLSTTFLLNYNHETRKRVCRTRLYVLTCNAYAIPTDLLTAKAPLFIKDLIKGGRS